MKVTNLIKCVIFILAITTISLGDVIAQQIYYVNVRDGLDGWDGSSPVFVGPGVGPKKTVNNAILNASAGDIISVDYAGGNLYNENVNVNKALTFRSTNGTPQVVSWDVSASVSLQGPFRLNTGLTLTNGLITGASNLTVGGQVIRTAGSVDSQLNYNGLVNFTYNGGVPVSPMITGFELPPTSNTTNFGNLTSTAGTDIRLNEDKTMNGVINTAAKIDLNGRTLNIINAAVATVHTVGGDITNGNMVFTLNSNSTINGLFKLPHVKTTAFTSVRMLTIANAVNFEGITNFGVGGVIISHDNAVTIGIVDLRAGTIDLSGSGSANTNVTVTGNASFIGGLWNMESTAGRILQLQGQTNTFSSASGRTDFSSANKVPASTMRNVTLEFSASTMAQNVTGNLIETVWFGPMIVNNTSGFNPAVTFQGGDFRVLDNVTFNNGRVKIIEKKLLVGGRLAPYVNLAGAGNFINTAGYVTEGNGFVSINSNVNCNVSGIGSFGNFEMDMQGNNMTVLPATGPMTSQFNLAKGTVVSSANVNFNYSIPPIIIRNEGVFDAAPTFTSKVDVIYINKDKNVSFEIPATPAFADRLRNLSVLTTNGTLVAGRGTVRVPPATPVTVNGTLIINSLQTLLLDGSNLYMKGPSITLNGDIANDAAGVGRLVLDNATGTAVTASSTLPDVVVNDGSAGNTIAGSSVTFASGLLGPNNLRGGGDDINPGNTGGILFAGGAVGSSLSINLGASNPSTGSHLNYVTTNAGASLILLNNLIQSGDLNHNAGTINLNTFTYRHFGTNPSFTGGSATTGTGTLIFNGSANTLVNLNLSGGLVPVIESNVEVNLSTSVLLFELSAASTASALRIRSNFYLTSGTVQLGNAVTTKHLYIEGRNFRIGVNGSINTIGIGTLLLNSWWPPLNVWLGGDRDLGNVTILQNVFLDPTSPGLSLGISGLFRHDNGLLDFNSRNITIKPTGNYLRTDGTYAATTGYLIIQSPLFNQGTTNFTIPNLRIEAGVPFAVANSANFTVTNTFDLFNAGANIFTHTFGGSPRLRIANGATVNYRDGDLDVPPVYEGWINLNAMQNMTSIIPANVWPAAPTTLVSHFNSMGWAGTSITLPGSRTVNNMLSLTQGITIVPGGTTFTVSNNATINVISGTLNVVGSRSFGTGINVFYKNDGTGPYFTGPELPTSVNNLTFTRNVNATNQFTNINTPVMVYGTLTIRNNVWTAAAPPVNATISTFGDVVIENESGTFPLATDPVTVFNAPLEFNGGEDQDLIVPAAGVDLTNGGVAAANIKINKSNSNDVVNLVGGNLTTGTVIFVNGLLVTGDHILTIPAPLPGLGQGFDRIGVIGDRISHVVGNIRKRLVNGGTVATSTNERSEFPVGADSLYRPVAITFKPAYGFPTIPNALAITINHVNERPTGTVGLPIADGVQSGVDIIDYPDFYWQISTNQNLSQYYFDLEMRSDGFADYDTVSALRIIRRHGDIEDTENEWRLQGNVLDYDNAQYQSDPSKPVVINQNSLGGLRIEGALFTYGLKSAKQEFYAPVWKPNNPFRAMTIFCTRSFIDGVSMGMGDEIGVFDGDKCVGAAVLNGTPSVTNPVQVVCSAKEDGQDNGFTDGHAITFRLWDNSESIEYNAIAQFYDTNTGVPIAPVSFEGLGTAVTQLDDNGIHAETQSIVLNEGWNMFSLGAAPNNGPDMLTILNPILVNLDKVLDEAGRSIVKLFGSWQNSIGNWTETEGYYIKMKAATTLVVEGSPVSTPLCINLTNGWNIISYPCLHSTQNALTIFQPLISAGNLVKVIDEGGNSIFKLFGNWLNSIGDCKPGEAYYVKVNTNCQLCISCPDHGSLPKSVGDSNDTPEPVHFSANLTGYPYQPMTLYIVESELDGKALVPGDEVAAFDGEKCVGVALVAKELSHSTPLELISVKDDGSGIGFHEGNPICFKVWRKMTNEEFSINSQGIQFLNAESGKPDAQGSFEGLGTAVIIIRSSTTQAVSEMIPATYQLEQNYPNPFNPSTSISYALPEMSQVKLEVFNLRGGLVKILFEGEQKAGSHVVEWDGRDNSGMKVASGIYLYKMTAQHFAEIKKMVLTK